MLTLKKVNKAIAKKFPLIYLVKGEGYFYIVSDDDKTGLKLAGLPQTGIYVYSINDLSIEQWIESVAQLIEYE